jgi:hypothetical protein
MKTFLDIRENLAPKGLMRTNITTRNVSDQKRNIGKLGYKISTKPVGGQEEKSGYEFRSKKVLDPFEKRQTAQRKFRDIDRGIKKSRRETGYR